ncbi:MAG: hypothetical protein R3208_04935 [Ketobacteraceae bacterium]|nr:hypothetical protein [Ketobacteraceae bacterium]
MSRTIQLKQSVSLSLRRTITATCTLAALLHAPAWAESPDTSDAASMRQQLEEAKLAILDAEKKAEEIIRAAREEASALKSGSHQEDVLSPLLIQNTSVSIEMKAGTLQEIVTAIMPEGWRVLVDVKDEAVRNRRFQFVSTRTREQALNDLLKPIGMKHQYFFDLKNGQGEPSPLLVVSKDR